MSAGVGCRNGDEQPQTPAAQIEAAQRESERAFERAQRAQRKAREEQDEAERARRELEEARANAERQMREAIAAQEQARSEAERAQQVAREAQARAAEAQRAFAPQVPDARETTLEGQVVALGERSLTVRSGGQEIQLELDPSTEIRLNGQPASTADLREGAEVRASYAERDQARVATRVEIVGPAQGGGSESPGSSQ